ncbi:hypothetical protein [Clostridium sp.]|uniref:hypothetical protein n=1 Tax=Clostridium sp. TaxID=1506 RepID=UPI003078C85C
MLVPLSWLKDYVDINISADELEKKLFDCGFEVEEKWQVGKDISGIVVGYVDSLSRFRKHIFMCARSM